MRAWIKAGNIPEAVYAANDPTAIGALRALAEAKIKVPEQVAVVGTGAIHYGDLLRIPLTTVDWNKIALGQQAAQLLIKLMAPEKASEKNGSLAHQSERVIIAPQLVIRQSCGAIPQKD
jgi:LacI family transcriptional regulator